MASWRICGVGCDVNDALYEDLKTGIQYPYMTPTFVSNSVVAIDPSSCQGECIRDSEGYIELGCRLVCSNHRT